ncbi:hypothetical protein DMC64_00265 [Amycolatopsis sp. WAC 04197]|nr:hypothetical protein DMC64_00265 [Amycolatopsis sp. WAC 04197]
MKASLRDSGSLKEAFTDLEHRARRARRRDSRAQARDSRDWKPHSGCSASDHASSGFDHVSAVLATDWAAEVLGMV